LPGRLLAAVLPVAVLPVSVLRGAVLLLARAGLTRVVGSLPGRGAIGLPLGVPGRLAESRLARRSLPGRVRSVTEAAAALVRVGLPGIRLPGIRLAGIGLAEPGLPEALLARWPRLTLARSCCLAPALPAGTVLSRLVLTRTGHEALSGT
jgi:hypothetical protein